MRPSLAQCRKYGFGLTYTVEQDGVALVDCTAVILRASLILLVHLYCRRAAQLTDGCTEASTARRTEKL